MAGLNNVVNYPSKISRGHTFYIEAMGITKVYSSYSEDLSILEDITKT